MKKVVVSVLLLVLLMTGFASVYAAGSYVPSVRPYFGFVTIDQVDGKDVVGYVVDKEGNRVDTVYANCIAVTTVIDAKNANHSPALDDAAKVLIDTYNLLNSPDTRLSKLIPVLNTVAKEELGEDADADDLVLRELIDITVVCEDLEKALAVEGNTLDLTFKMPVNQDCFITALTLNDDEWDLVEQAVNNNDGTVTVTFDHFCPVLFVNAPESGVPAFDWTTVIIGILLFLLILLLLLYILLRNKNKKVEENV